MIVCLFVCLCVCSFGSCNCVFVRLFDCVLGCLLVRLCVRLFDCLVGLLVVCWFDCEVIWWCGCSCMCAYLCVYMLVVCVCLRFWSCVCFVCLSGCSVLRSFDRLCVCVCGVVRFCVCLRVRMCVIACSVDFVLGVSLVVCLVCVRVCLFVCLIW